MEAGFGAPAACSGTQSKRCNVQPFITEATAFWPEGRLWPFAPKLPFPLGYVTPCHLIVCLYSPRSNQKNRKHFKYLQNKEFTAEHWLLR